MGADLWQGYILPPLRFGIVMDRISRRTCGWKGIRFRGLEVTSLLSGQNLKQALQKFDTECGAAGMKIHTTTSEGMVLWQKRKDCSFQVRGLSL